jgi:hypothetical protein
MQERLTVVNMIVKNYFEQNSFIACTSIRGSSLLAESIRRYQLADRKRSPGGKFLLITKWMGKVLKNMAAKPNPQNTAS